MYAPGIVGLAFALIVLLFMRDNPENFGHAPVQAPKPKAAAEPKGVHQLTWSPETSSPISPKICQPLSKQSFSG